MEIVGPRLVADLMSENGFCQVPGLRGPARGTVQQCRCVRDRLPLDQNSDHSASSGEAQGPGYTMNRNNALQWLIPTAATGGLIAADTHIANAFENSRGQVRWGGRVSNIGASYTLLFIVAGSYLYGAWRDNPKGREVGVLGTESLLDSPIVAGVLKEVFRRNRPDEKHPGDFWGGGDFIPFRPCDSGLVHCVSVGSRKRIVR